LLKKTKAEGKVNVKS